MIRILLVDDQQAVRRGLRLRFHLEPDIQIVGEASTGKEALSLAQKLAPDVVLMDIEMPEMDGIETTAALRAAFSQSAVVILSTHSVLLEWDWVYRGRHEDAGDGSKSYSATSEPECDDSVKWKDRKSCNNFYQCGKHF